MPPIVAKVVGVGQRIADLADIAQAQGIAELAALAVPILEGIEMRQVPAHRALDDVVKLQKRHIGVGVEPPPHGGRDLKQLNLETPDRC